MKKIYSNIKGVITEIGELVHIERDGIPDLFKRVLTIEGTDGQILYPEVRNGKLKMLENFSENSVVNVEYSFEGSTKNNKKYNNIYVNNLTRVEV